MTKASDSAENVPVNFDLRELEIHFEKEHREVFLLALKPPPAESDLYVAAAEKIVRKYLIAKSLNIKDAKTHKANYKNIQNLAHRLRTCLQQDLPLSIVQNALAQQGHSVVTISGLEHLIDWAKKVRKDEEVSAKSRLHISGRTDPRRKLLWLPFFSMWNRCGYKITLSDDESPLFEFIWAIHAICGLDRPDVEALRTVVRDLARARRGKPGPRKPVRTRDPRNSSG